LRTAAISRQGQLPRQKYLISDNGTMRIGANNRRRTSRRNTPLFHTTRLPLPTGDKSTAWHEKQSNPASDDPAPITNDKTMFPKNNPVRN
jgi:hypothetical protein